MTEAVELLTRLRGGATQRAFAERVGLHPSEVSRLFAGARGPTAGEVVRLLVAFPDERDAILAAFGERDLEAAS